MRKKYSAIWEHFDDEGGNRAKCKICSRAISFLGGSQGNLNRHMKTVHPGVMSNIDEVAQATFNLIEREMNDGQPSTSTETTNGNKVLFQKSGSEFCGDPGTTATEAFQDKRMVRCPLKGRRKFSPAWLHFDDVGGYRAKCKFCCRLISYLGGSHGNLNRHMRLKHPDMLTLEEVVQSTGNLVKQEQKRDKGTSENAKKTDLSNSWFETTVSEFGEDPLETEPTIDNSKKTSIGKPSPKKSDGKDPEQINRQLLRMIIKGQHSFRIAEEPAFKELVQEVTRYPGYCLPTRKRLSNILLPKVQREILESIKHQIRHTTDVCLAFDKWSSRTNDCYVALTAHYINRSTELNSHLLACQELKNGHNAISFYEFLSSVIAEFDINNKIIVIVSDNSPDIADAISHGNWLGIACFAHSLNSTVRTSLESIAVTIDNVRKIAEYTSMDMEELNELINIPRINVKLDDPDRWTTTYEMLQNINQIYHDVILTISSKHTDCFLSSKDLEIIAETLPILKPFYEVVKEISAEKHLCLSKVTILCNILETYVSQNFPINPEVGVMLSNLQLGLFSCFGSIENEYLHAESALLDPRFKRRSFRNDDTYKDAVKSLSNKINSLALPNQTEELDESTRSTNVKTESLWNDYDTEFNKTVKFNSEFEKYLNEDYLDRKMDPLVWWKQRKSIYPNVYSYALKRLCIVATSVPCERIFSAAGQILTEKRTLLKPKTVEGLVFLHNNM